MKNTGVWWSVPSLTFYLYLQMLPTLLLPKALYTYYDIRLSYQFSVLGEDTKMQNMSLNPVLFSLFGNFCCFFFYMDKFKNSFRAEKVWFMNPILINWITGFHIHLQGFPNSSNGGGWKILPGGKSFLPVEGYLRRNDFDNSNFFQS